MEWGDHDYREKQSSVERGRGKYPSSLKIIINNKDQLSKLKF